MGDRVVTPRLPWPYNMLRDLDIQEYPKDEDELQGTIAYVLAVVKAPPEEKELFRLYYQEGISRYKLAKRESTTDAKIFAHIENVSFKLRNNPRFKELLHLGVAEFADRSYREKERSEFKRAVEEAAATMVAEGTTDVPVDIVWSDQTPISDLDLPVRCRNGLLRRGLKTVGSILSLENRFDLMQIHALGKQSIDTILDVLQEKGFDVTHLRK